ncbi:MAG: carbohydrate ABC transporter permease, partial [Bryobacteraceae bacterium]
LFFLLRRYDPGAGTRAIVLIVAILLGVATLLFIGWKMPYSFYAVLVANIWLGWPFMMTVATGALQGIPEELYEAARIDGASAWQSFWQVTVPLLRPSMIPAIMIGMMMTFNQFNVIYFVTAGNPLHRTEILVTQAFRLVNEQRMYGVAAAFSFIVFVILAGLTMITNRVSRATESYAI